MKQRKLIKILVWVIFILFVLLNIVSFFHAYKFTHYSTSAVTKTKEAKALSSVEKLKTLLFGIKNPKPINTAFPKQPFETIKLQSFKTIECWSIKTMQAKGTVILFHGYSGNKSSMLDKSDEFLNLDYNTLLVDFMGCGNSEGNQTTLGFKEALDVKTAYEYLVKRGEKRIFLFGTSLGAVAVLKAISDYNLSPEGIIIECPFGSMYKTTCARFRSMKIPAFPMAGFLVFWGGLQNGFWAFGHNPTSYAKNVSCPTLLLYGEKDDKVSPAEIDEIFKNLKGAKKLINYPFAGHENYLTHYKKEWIKDISHFLP